MTYRTVGHDVEPNAMFAESKIALSVVLVSKPKLAS